MSILTLQKIKEISQLDIFVELKIGLVKTKDDLCEVGNIIVMF